MVGLYEPQKATGYLLSYLYNMRAGLAVEEHFLMKHYQTYGVFSGYGHVGMLPALTSGRRPSAKDYCRRFKPEASLNYDAFGVNYRVSYHLLALYIKEPWGIMLEILRALMLPQNPRPSLLYLGFHV